MLEAIGALVIELISKAWTQFSPSPIRPRLQGAQFAGWKGQKAKRMTAVQAFDVLKENEVAATVTVKNLHELKIEFPVRT
jgi:hypothetical protein